MDKEKSKGRLTLEQTLEALENNLKQIEAQKGLEHLDRADLLSKIGSIHWEMGSYSKAVFCGQQALKIIEKEFGPDHSHTITCVENLISGLIAVKLYSQAQTMRNRYLRYLTDEHPRCEYFMALEN